jgi:hypothetical protein
MSASQASNRMVARRYVLRDALGRGGMGTVWRAEDDVLKRQVAIKEVALPASVSPEERKSLRARTLREARAAARLSHPSAVMIFDVHEEDGRAFIVMELVEAPSLKEVVERNGPIDPAEAAAIGIDVLAALENAHREGIVHRDVKPANVMVPSRGRAKLADFGIASVKGDPKLTASGMVLGSPQYMAPEQARGQVAGPETDLWGLGATLYFAVEGEPPFDRGPAIPTLTAVVHEPPRSPQAAGELGPVIESLLHKEPEKRPSATEITEVLEKVAAGSHNAPVASRTTPADTRAHMAPAYQAADQDSDYETAPATARGPRSWFGWLTAALLVALLAVGAWLVVSSLTRDDEASTGRTTGGAERPDGQPGEGAPPGGAQVPADWETFTNAEAGYEFAYPSGWQILRGRGGVSRNIDFEDPETGNYIRVAWTPSPGPSPEGAWESLSDSFAQTHDAYRELQITPTSFKGMDAALWEYTWTEGGADLHAYDLGFVTADRGFALNFVTEESDWESSQDLWRQFKAAFRVSE